MRLSIEAIKQEGGCGLACLRMVLGYYGLPLRDDDFTPQDPSGGTTLVELGSFATQRGFPTTCYSYHLQLFDPQDAALPRAQLLRKVVRIERELAASDHPEAPALHDLTLDIIRAMEAGVRYVIQKPTARLVGGLLSAGIPPIVSVYAPALRDERQRHSYAWSGHSVLLTGIDGETVYYLDPHHLEERSVSLDHLFFAMLSRPLTGMTAYLVAIKPRATAAVPYPAAA